MNENIKFNGISILIVDDDITLTTKLKNELYQYNINKCTEIRSMEKANSELSEHGHEYELVILDIMLPETEKDYENIVNKNDELKIYRETLLHAEETITDLKPEDDKKLALARERRPIILQEIQDLIEMKGGLKILKEWFNEYPDVPKPPIIIFSAFGDKELQDEAMHIAKWKNIEWLVKPVLPRKIVTTIQKMLDMNDL